MDFETLIFNFLMESMEIKRSIEVTEYIKGGKQ